MNPNTLCGAGLAPHIWQEDYYGDRCTVCGLFYASGCAPWDDADPDDFDDEDDGEPIGSCENCGANVYACDVDEDLCDQCAWHVYKANEEEE